MHAGCRAGTPDAGTARRRRDARRGGRGDPSSSCIEGASLAAVNGPNSVVVSGDAEAVAGLEAVWRAEGRRVKRLDVSHAFHSPHMEPMLTEFRAVAESLTYHAPAIPIVPTAPGSVDTPEYWVGQVREAVRFADGVSVLGDKGVTRFIEIGPDGVLSAAARGCLEGVDAIAMQRAGREGVESWWRGVADAHVCGVPVDWPSVCAEWGGRVVDLPTYAFQREHFWPEPAPSPVVAATEEDGWRYRVTWKPLPDGPLPVLRGTWRVLTRDPDGTLATWCADALRVHGAEVIVGPEHGPADGVLSLLTGDEPHPEHPLLTRGLSDTLSLVNEDGAPLWIATRGAVRVGTEDLTDPTGAGIWALGRVAALEAPRRWGGLIDLPDTLDTSTAQSLAAALAGTGEDQLAIRTGGRYGRRLAPSPTTFAQPWSPQGTVLVTGGTGALGRHVARWLAHRGTPHIVLASRRGPQAPGISEFAADLDKMGTRVTVLACDVADRSALDALLAEYPPTAVFHAAGSGDFGALAETSIDDFAAVLEAKVRGAENLDAALGDVDAFVLFSSVSATWGSGGQAAYATANAALDALAERRRARGATATSVAWGPWAGDGMAGDESTADYLRGRGLNPMDPPRAVAALARAVDQGDTCVAVADVNWARFVSTFTAARPQHLFDDLPGVVTEQAKPVPELARRLAGLSDQDLRRTLAETVRSLVAVVLGHSGAAAIDPRKAFSDLGFDSLTAVELRDHLNAATGLRLPATLVFDHPTPSALADHLYALVRGDDTRAAAVVAVAADEPIAIIGMSCRYPGGVTSAEDLWQLLAEGRDGMSAFPDDRGWDLGDASYVREGGFLHDAAYFDPAFFGISPARRWRWTRSRGCCWRRRGRCSNVPGSTRNPCGPAGPACSRAPTARITQHCSPARAT